MKARQSPATHESLLWSWGRTLLILISFSLIYWLLESSVHTYILHTSSFRESFLHPHSHEIWQRLSALAIILTSLTICSRLRYRLRKSEHERSLSKWKEALISENISEHMIIYNKEFFIQWANRAASSSLNMAPHELVGKRCYELWHRRTEPCEICPVIKAIETREPQEALVSTYDGRHWFIRGYPIIGETGEIEGAAEITLEITKLKEAEREAKDKSARLEAILKSVSDGVVMADPRGIITYVNNSLERILNVSREEAIGKHINHLIFLKDPNKSHRITVPISKVLSLEHGDSVICKGVLKNGEGPIRLISISSSPIIAGDTKEVSGLVLSIRDITQNERALESFFKEKKSESLGKFALGIAHELNNIIHSISSNLSLLKTTLRAHEEKNELLEDIGAATTRLKNLSEELRWYARDEKPVAVRVSIPGLVSEVAGSTFQGSNLTLTQSLDKGIPQIEVDKDKISRAFEAILSFVRDSTTRGKIIELSVTTEEISEEDEIPLSPGDYIFTSVKVNQYIVPKDMIASLFDPYSSVSNSQRGLQLSIASSTIKSHGGTIEVVSSIENGTEFKIYLPITRKETAVAAPIEAGGKKAEARILAMDDDEIVRKALKKILEFYGYDVTMTSTGEEAVESYREALSSGKPFDAAIIDLTVKHGLGGKETAKRILELDHNARLIISSGYKSDKVMVDYKEYGFKAAIAKPYKAETLNRVLSEILSTETPIG